MQFLNQAGDVSGESLGTLLRVLDIATAAKHGSVGSALARQAALTTDPDARQAVAGSPLLAGFTGAYGDRQPLGNPGMGEQGPQVPPGFPSQFQANLPPQSTLAQLEELAKRYNVAQTIARIPLLDAQARNQGALADLTQRYLGTGETQGQSGLGLRQIGPAGATFAPPTGVDVMEGTIGPGGTAVTPGQVLPGNRTVSTIRPKLATRGQQSVEGQLRRAITAKNVLETAFGPRKDGTSPFDLLPAASESPGSGLLRTVPGVQQLTTAGNFPLTGLSIPKLAREGNADALALTTGTVQRSALARAYGEVGNLNEQEQRIVEQLLPSEHDTKELGQAKYAYAVKLLDSAIEGLQSGQLSPEQVKDLFLSAGANTSPSTAPGPASLLPSTPAPTAGTSITPEQANDSLDFINRGGRAAPDLRKRAR